jgi:hypothetical protein
MNCVHETLEAEFLAWRTLAVRPRAVCRIRARARVGILSNAQCVPTDLFPPPVKVTRDNALDGKSTVTATAALELPHPKTIRDLTLSTSVGWHSRAADLRSKKSLENSFTKREAPMRDFPASYHATASSATTANVVQSKTAIDNVTSYLVGCNDHPSEGTQQPWHY